MAGKDLLNRIPTAHTLRQRIDNWNLIRLRSFRKAKGSAIQVKRQPEHQTIPGTEKLNVKKRNNPTINWGMTLNREFSREI